MSTLVFSDTHFTKYFDEKRYLKLVELIQKADKVIINGDFWEGLTITLDDFLNSKWNQLFPLLKSKKAIYVYGNHDDPDISGDGIYQFCEKAVDEYKLETPTKKYFFTHGQEFLFPHHTEKDLTKKKALKLLTKIDVFIATIIQFVIFNIFGAQVFPKKFNEMTLEKRKEIAPLDYLLVCGHSHRPQYNPEINFMDIGFFNYGWANYLLIEENGEFRFVSEKY